MQSFQLLTAFYAVFGLAALVVLIRWESRQFTRAGKARAWLRVRLASVPIALATAALVLAPARAAPGMAALAVFYMLLFVAAPVFWAGAHVLIGRRVQPPLTTGESLRIAVSPVVLGLVFAGLAPYLQMLVWPLLR